MLVNVKIHKILQIKHQVVFFIWLCWSGHNIMLLGGFSLIGTGKLVMIVGIIDDKKITFQRHTDP